MFLSKSSTSRKVESSDGQSGNRSQDRQTDDKQGDARRDGSDNQGSGVTDSRYSRPRQPGQNRMPQNRQHHFSPYDRSGGSRTRNQDHGQNISGQDGQDKSMQNIDSMLTDRKRRDESQSSTGTASGQQKQFSAEEMKRKIYVGNLPENATVADIHHYFSKVGTVKNVQLKSQKHYAFVEFSTREDARKAIAVTDETTFMGQQIRVKSTDKNRSKAANPNNPHRLFIGYIPHQMSEKQIRELFETLGPLNYFFLVMDSQTGKSKGYAFCEYEDTSITSTAIERLHGREIMGKRLVVQRANDPEKKAANVQKFIQQIVNYKENTLESALSNILDIFQNPNYSPTNMIQLLNMFDPEEYRNNQAKIEQLRDEVLFEAEKYGSVFQMIVPIPDFDPDGEGSWRDGFGRVFIQFGTSKEAIKAINNMNGRTFHGRLIACSFYSEDDMNKAIKERSFEGIN